jgi:putative transposase
MPSAYQIKEQDKVHYLTLQIVYWIDIFSRKQYKDIIIESFKYCQQHKGLELFAYVIMSNHIHMIVRSSLDDLSGVLRDFKKYTSKRIIEIAESAIESRRNWILRLFKHAAKRQNKKGNYQVWTHENHAILLYSNKMMQEKVDYIHNNPVRAGIVKNQEDYIYSSASNYVDDSGLLDIILIDRQWKTY